MERSDSDLDATDFEKEVDEYVASLKEPDPELSTLWLRMKELRRVLQLFPNPPTHEPTPNAECIVLEFTGDEENPFSAMLCSPRAGNALVGFFDPDALVHAVRGGDLAHVNESERQLLMWMVSLSPTEFKYVLFTPPLREPHDELSCISHCLLLLDSAALENAYSQVRAEGKVVPQESSMDRRDSVRGELQR